MNIFLGIFIRRVHLTDLRLNSFVKVSSVHQTLYQRKNADSSAQLALSSQKGKTIKPFRMNKRRIGQPTGGDFIGLESNCRYSPSRLLTTEVWIAHPCENFFLKKGVIQNWVNCK